MKLIKKNSVFVTVMAVLALGAGFVPAGTLRGEGQGSQGRKPLLEQTFETTQGNWIVFGNAAQIRVATDAAHVKDGKGALAVDYQIAAGQFGVAALPIPEGTFAGMKQLRFWLQTDSTAPITLLLSERKPGGGNYSTLIWAPKGVWQQIELVPEDFSPNEGKTDPVDPDHKLDMDQVEALSIIDLGQLFAQASGPSDVPITLDKRLGAHSLCIDDLQALAEAPAAPPAGKGVVIDDFHRGFLSWLTLGGVEFSLDASGKALAGRALQANYEQAPGAFVVIARTLPEVDLRGSDRLTFDLASTVRAQLLVAVELHKPGGQGPRFNTTVDVPGGQQPLHQEIVFANMAADPKSPAAPGGKIDPTLIKTFSLIDITSAFGGGQAKNTLWIGNVRAEGPGS